MPCYMETSRITNQSILEDNIPPMSPQTRTPLSKRKRAILPFEMQIPAHSIEHRSMCQMHVCSDLHRGKPGSLADQTCPRSWNMAPA